MGSKHTYRIQYSTQRLKVEESRKKNEEIIGKLNFL